MFICPRSPGHPVPHVSVYPNLTEFEAELAQEDEECFGWATARLALQEISLETYFERLIDHIREGGARHTWDKAKTNLQHALQVDLIAGAFKSRMLKKAIGKISAVDADALKTLCLTFYHQPDPVELQRDVGVQLASSPPWIIDILGMIAYARRHVGVLAYLTVNFRASTSTSPRGSKTSFDLLGPVVLSPRAGQSTKFEHGGGDNNNNNNNNNNNRVTEWKLWTALLRAEKGAWLHYPLSQTTDAAGLPAGLYHGLHWLADYWAHDPHLRDTDECREFLAALNEGDVVLGPVTISRFLSITEGTSMAFTKGDFLPVGLESARTMLEAFPMSEVLTPEYPGGDSAQIALPLTQWPLKNGDRLTIMEMLLEQGLRVDGRLADYGWTAGQGRPETQIRDTCLIQSAERGDMDMVKLLVGHGAGKDEKGAHGQTAAERARSKRHVKVAKWLESD
ncbi:hypothetical protein G7054_g5455 [Neopestalotiopsis clavispora]|nr:hypothetical protein G7054_g5455 [Neopestalotiopsis clavispora]